MTRASTIDRVAGGFFLVMAGINIGLVVADGNVYRHFADGGLFDFVSTGWRTIVMEHPGAWVGLLAAGKLGIGAAILAGGPWARAGYAAAITFQLALMLFGWGFWAWSVPAIVVLTLAVRARDEPASNAALAA